MHNLHPFLRKFLGESLGPPLSKEISITQPYCSTAAYIAPRLVYDPVPSGSGFSFSIHHWQCAFLAQFYKRYSLVWVSLKGLICTPDCTVLLHFFKNFLGAGPPNPHLQEGRPLPYPPPLGPSGLEKPPKFGFWVRHWYALSLYSVISSRNSQTVIFTNCVRSNACNWRFNRFKGQALQLLPIFEQKNTTKITK